MLTGSTLRGTMTILALALCAGSLIALPSDVFARGKKKGDEDPAAAEFAKAYKSDDAKARAEAVTSLKKASDELKVDLIASHLFPKEKRADVMLRAVEVLSRVKEPAAVKKVVGFATHGKTDRRVVFVEALAKIDNMESHEALLDLIEDKEPRVRGMAAYGLGMHRSMDALDPLMGALDDRFWQVQSAALEAIPRLSDKDQLKQVAVPKLVDFLDNVSGRLAHDTADKLARITGKRLGKDVTKWRKYLAGDSVSAEASEGGAGGAYGNANERPHFYGMEVVSNRVVLIVDISLSMNDPIEIDKDRLRRETSRRKAVTGAKAEAGEPVDEDRAYDIPWWRIKTRLDLAREQMILLISQMHAEQEFDMIFYSTKVDSWMGRLVPANSANKQKAIAALQSMKPDDKTNTWGALAMAFDLMGNQKKSYEKGPDELYLVTDGAPSAGDITEQDQILEAVLQLHKTKPIRINCIGIGVNFKFMRKMARATGGKHKSFQ